jgi:hypothetical protein
MVHYYYTDGKERFGPFSIEELKEKPITPQTLVWKEGLPDWVPANTLADLNTIFPETPEEIVTASNKQTVHSLSVAPKNWLIESVLVTIFCCLPIGIVGIILALLVDTLWKEGHKEAAERLSLEAGKWVKYGIIFGVIALVLYMLLMSAGILTGIGGGVPV